MASDKEQLWLTEYLKCWNATEAARRAGYAWPNKQGPDKKKKFAAEIQEAIAERVMSADEVLVRLAEQARGIDSQYFHIAKLNPFDEDEGPDVIDDITVNFAKLIKDGKGHLIKTLSFNKDHDLTKVEFLDAQAALVHIGRHHALFTDKVETPRPPGVVGLAGLGDLADMDDEDLSDRITKLQRIQQRLDNVEGGAGLAANGAGDAPGAAAAPTHPASQGSGDPDA